MPNSVSSVLRMTVYGRKSLQHCGKQERGSIRKNTLNSMPDAPRVFIDSSVLFSATKSLLGGSFRLIEECALKKCEAKRSPAPRTQMKIWCEACLPLATWK